jgi:putative hydrolase of the HAD superfamily
MPFDPSRVDCWIFDLDNTLYPAETCLFDQIDVRMGAYIADLLGCDHAEARRVQKMYFHDHGTTLAGLMHFHGVDPYEFLGYVHDVDMAPLPARRAWKNG